MKQRILALALAACLLFAGCGGASAPSSSAAGVEEGRTLTGKVKSVSGNELELAIGTLENQRGGGGEEEESAPEKSPSQDRGNSSQQAGSPPSGGGAMMSPPTGGGAMSGGITSFTIDSASKPASTGPAIQLTGEVETISIPVGTPVTMSGSTTTLDFSQIVVKNVITITYATGDDGTEHIASVTILS